jgi:acid phosphatase class B
MSRRAARITQADVARAIRAAQQCGAGTVRIMPDGTITIDPKPAPGEKAEKELEPHQEIVL